MRRIALITLLLLSMMTTGIGTLGAHRRQESSPPEGEARLLNDREVLVLGLGKFDDAIELFTQAIARNPRLTFAYYNRGKPYLIRKESRRAADDCSEAIRINPDFALAYMHRGVAFSMQNELEDALTDLKKAVELDPGQVDGYYNRAMVFTKNGKAA